MKLTLAVLVSVWFICGLGGAWRLDELDIAHWRDVARGPITLAEAFNENPVNYPGP